MHLNRLYCGTRPDNPIGTGIVLVDSPTAPEPTIGKPFRHAHAQSVSTFNWGADAYASDWTFLADALLQDALDYNDVSALSLGINDQTVNDFAEFVVANMPNVWSLFDGQVLEWAEKRKEKAR